MAPTVAICRSSSKAQSRESMGYAKRSVASSGIWVCQPTAMPPMSGALSSCATRKKGSFHAKSAAPLNVALDSSLKEEEQEAAVAAVSVCETPKAKKHRIPAVDVDLCPPAPKKARRAHSGLLPGACSSERERSNFLQKLNFSRSYLF